MRVIRGNRISQQQERVLYPGEWIVDFVRNTRGQAPHLHFEIWKDGQPIDPRTQVTQPPGRSP